MTERMPFSKPRQAMRTSLPANDRHFAAPSLTVEQLEEGLRMLDGGEIEPTLFWDQTAAAFRKTIIIAIAETSTALSSRRLSDGLRAELEGQVEPLNFYLRIADDYLARGRHLH